MGYYNELFIEKEGKLTHVGSCDGSGAPQEFDNVETLEGWKQVLTNMILDHNTYFCSHNKVKHCFPWKTYKTSDALIVLRPCRKYWFQFWKPKYEVWASIDKSKIDDDHKSYFVRAKHWRGDINYSQFETIILNFPKIPGK